MLIRELNVSGYKINIPIGNSQLENKKYLLYSKFYKVAKVLVKDINLDMKLDMNKRQHILYLWVGSTNIA